MAPRPTMADDRASPSGPSPLEKQPRRKRSAEYCPDSEDKVFSRWHVLRALHCATNREYCQRSTDKNVASVLLHSEALQPPETIGFIGGVHVLRFEFVRDLVLSSHLVADLGRFRAHP